MENNSIFICSSKSFEQHLPTLRRWLVEQWTEVDPFSEALLAVEGERLAGGLVFTNYPVPKTKEPGLWINALYVAPEYRRKGIATRLIDAAESKMSRDYFEELYVYTNIPLLYIKAGWEIVKDEGSHKVLKKYIS